MIFFASDRQNSASHSAQRSTGDYFFDSRNKRFHLRGCIAGDPARDKLSRVLEILKKIILAGAETVCDLYQILFRVEIPAHSSPELVVDAAGFQEIDAFPDGRGIEIRSADGFGVLLKAVLMSIAI